MSTANANRPAAGAGQGVRRRLHPVAGHVEEDRQAAGFEDGLGVLAAQEPGAPGDEGDPAGEVGNLSGTVMEAGRKEGGGRTGPGRREGPSGEGGWPSPDAAAQGAQP